VAKHGLNMFDAVITAVTLAVPNDQAFKELGVNADVGGPRNFSHPGRSTVSGGVVVATGGR
jgi:hypothetical protein